MKLFSFVFVLVTMISACGSSKKTEDGVADDLRPDAPAHRLAISVTVDGSLAEWPQPLPGYSKETALHFGVTNSKDFLFVAVACGEDQIQKKILRRGMELYFSQNGRKETLRGIGFPLPAVKINRSVESITGETKTPEQMAKEYRSDRNMELTEMQIFGLRKIADGIYPLESQNTVKIAYSWSANNFLNIEYAIPLKEVFESAMAVNNSNIEIGFKLNGSNEKVNTRQGGNFAGDGMRGSGMGRGGMGRSGSGMRGGGMRGGGMSQGAGQTNGINRAELSKDQSFWSKYRITTSGI